MKMKKHYLGELDREMPIGILNTLYEDLGIYIEYEEGHNFCFINVGVEDEKICRK